MNAPLRPLTDETVRRATAEDVPRIARLFAAVFATDPVFEWLTRDDRSRHKALERFFLRVLKQPHAALRRDMARRERPRGRSVGPALFADCNRRT